jgi:DNA-nicking Smr family endonuclease
VSRAAKSLSDEDRVLWTIVARTTTPLKGRKSVEEPAPAAMPTPQAFAESLAPAPVVAPKPVPKKPAPVQAGMDRPIHDKLKNGRLPIEGRVDLHGMTQDQAYALLHSFLSRAHANGVRFVLVITGKGSSSGGDGVLRRAVPGWLATAPFRSLVSSHDHAARNHGGAGALYVRLRRNPPR